MSRRLHTIAQHLEPVAKDAGANSMPDGLQRELAAMRAKRNFQPRRWIEAKTRKLNDYLRRAGLSGCVVSVSGGVDSAVTYALMIEASKLPDSPLRKTIGIAQPIHSTKSVWKRAFELRAIGGQIISVDQTSIFDQLASAVHEATKLKDSMFANGQLRSYMRTPVNYYVAQLLSANGNGSIVLGTGNYDEDGYLRYFCKAGDGTVDVQLIADLHKSEVFRVGRELGVPESILAAPPTADLWEGQTDEDEMGFPYDFVELYTTWNEYSQSDKDAFLHRLDSVSKAYFIDKGNQARKIHEKNAHKASWPVNL